MEHSKFHVQKLALGAGISFVLFRLLCVLLVAISPTFATKLTGLFFHLADIEKFTGEIQMAFQGELLALVATFVAAYIGALLFGWTYNTLLKS